MKERLINVLKWLLITFGVLFLIQILIVIGFVLGLKGFWNNEFSYKNNYNKNLKEMKPIINYAENYKLKNGEYPEKIENVKIKPDLYFNYETSNNNECYTIKIKPKKADKKDLIKKYQHCSTSSENINSNTQSYIEYTD